MLEIVSRKHSADIYFPTIDDSNKAYKSLSFFSWVFELQQHDQMTILNWIFYKSKAADTLQMLERMDEKEANLLRKITGQGINWGDIKSIIYNAA